MNKFFHLLAMGFIVSGTVLSSGAFTRAPAPQLSAISSYHNNTAFNRSDDRRLNAAGTGFLAPAGIVLNTAGTLAFVTNRSIVSRCNVNADGVFSGCQVTGGTGFFGPYGIVLNSGGTRAFVTNTINNTVNSCHVNAEGTFSGCQNTGAGFLSAFDIVLNPGGTLAFVTNESTVSRCSVNTEGAFSGCRDTGGTSFSDPAGIVLNQAGSRAFVANTNSDTVSRCNVDDNGDFSGCQDTGGTGFSSPAGIVLNQAGTRAFIANADSDTVSRCNVDANGNFSGCRNSGGTGFSSSVGIVLNPAGTRVFVTNQDANTVTRCNVAADGAFSHCIDVMIGIAVTQSDGEPLPAVYIEPASKQSQTFQVTNTGKALSDFYVVLPHSEGISFAGTTCPLTPSSLVRGAHCTIRYMRILSQFSAVRSDIQLKSGSSVISTYTLEAALFAAINSRGERLGEGIKTYTNGSDTLTLHSIEAVTNVDIALSQNLKDAGVTLSGSCISTPDAIIRREGCTLSYHAAMNSLEGQVTGSLQINYGQPKQTFLLPFTVSRFDFTVNGTSVGHLVMQNKSRTTLTLTNYDRGSPVSDFDITFDESTPLSSHIVSNDCSTESINVAGQCHIVFDVPLRAKPLTTHFLVTLSHMNPIDFPVTLTQRPELPVTVYNRGGYRLGVHYFQYDADHNVIRKSMSFLNPSNRTINAIENSDIRLHAIAASGWTKCAQVTRANGQIRCTRGTLNMNCYWINGDHGPIAGVNGSNACLNNS